MAKTRAERNKEYKETLELKGDKRLTIVLPKLEAEKLESFMTLHNLRTYREFINFATNYNLVQFNDVTLIDSNSHNKSNQDTFMYKGKKYEILVTPNYGSMCRDIESKTIFPFP